MTFFSRQQNLGDSLVAISKDLPTEIHKLCMTMVTENHSSAEISRLGDNKSIRELQDRISILQKNIINRFDTLKTSMQKLETTCENLKSETNTRSASHDSRFDEVKNLSQRTFETVSDVRFENRRTRDNIAEMERSINAMSVSEDFQLVTKSRKENKEIETKNDSVKANAEIIVGDTEEEENEVTFPNKMKNAASIQHSDSNTSNSSSNQETKAPDSNSCNKELETNPIVVENESSENNPTIASKVSSNRKQKVCLIGDSLVGQLNVPLLGKGTNSYVQRLKAPKIQEIEKHMTEANDAKIIIIHSGINNLREKEQTESCVGKMLDTVASLKLAAPQAKIVISQILPVGDHDLNLDSSVLNAQLEKKLIGTHNDVIFIKHINLTDQGQIIKDYYRQDKLHLSSKGVWVFGRYLHFSILTSLNQKVGGTHYTNTK